MIANEANRVEEITMQCEYDKQLERLNMGANLIKAVHTPKRIILNLRSI